MLSVVALLISISHLEARLHEKPLECLVNNFENSADKLEYKAMGLDFLFKDNIGLLDEWQTGHVSEHFGKPKFTIGSFGIKSHHTSPHKILYGVSKGRIHAVKGGIFQFNLYKESKKLFSHGGIASISIMLFDSLTHKKENFTLTVNDQIEGWSQPVLRITTSIDMASYIWLLGHSSESLFFYIDAFRYDAYNHNSVDCQFYDASKERSLFLKESTTLVTKTLKTTQEEAGTTPLFETSTEKKLNFELNKSIDYEASTSVFKTSLTKSVTNYIKPLSKMDKKQQNSISLSNSSGAKLVKNKNYVLESSPTDLPVSFYRSRTLMDLIHRNFAHINTSDERNIISGKKYDGLLNMKKKLYFESSMNDLKKASGKYFNMNKNYDNLLTKKNYENINDSITLKDIFNRIAPSSNGNFNENIYINTSNTNYINTDVGNNKIIRFFLLAIFMILIAMGLYVHVLLSKTKLPLTH